MFSGRSKSHAITSLLFLISLRCFIFSRIDYFFALRACKASHASYARVWQISRISIFFLGCQTFRWDIDRASSSATRNRDYFMRMMFAFRQRWWLLFALRCRFFSFLFGALPQSDLPTLMRHEAPHFRLADVISFILWYFLFELMNVAALSPRIPASLSFFEFFKSPQNDYYTLFDFDIFVVARDADIKSQDISDYFGRLRALRHIFDASHFTW